MNNLQYVFTYRNDYPVCTFDNSLNAKVATILKPVTLFALEVTWFLYKGYFRVE